MRRSAELWCAASDDAHSSLREFGNRFVWGKNAIELMFHAADPKPTDNAVLALLNDCRTSR